MVNHKANPSETIAQIGDLLRQMAVKTLVLALRLSELQTPAKGKRTAFGLAQSPSVIL